MNIGYVIGLASVFVAIHVGCLMYYRGRTLDTRKQFGIGPDVKLEEAMMETLTDVVLELNNESIPLLWGTDREMIRKRIGHYATIDNRLGDVNQVFRIQTALIAAQLWENSGQYYAVVAILGCIAPLVAVRSLPTELLWNLTIWISFISFLAHGVVFLHLHIHLARAYKAKGKLELNRND